MLLPGRNNDLDLGRVLQGIPFNADALLVLTGRIQQEVVLAGKQFPERRLAGAASPKNEDTGLAGTAAEPGLDILEFAPNFLTPLPEPGGNFQAGIGAAVGHTGPLQ